MSVVDATHPVQIIVRDRRADFQRAPYISRKFPIKKKKQKNKKKQKTNTKQKQKANKTKHLTMCTWGP